jgi:hypothetical protein
MLVISQAPNSQFEIHKSEIVLFLFDFSEQYKSGFAHLKFHFHQVLKARSVIRIPNPRWMAFSSPGAPAYEGLYANAIMDVIASGFCEAISRVDRKMGIASAQRTGLAMTFEGLNCFP